MDPIIAVVLGVLVVALVGTALGRRRGPADHDENPYRWDPGGGA